MWFSVTEDLLLLAAVKSEKHRECHYYSGCLECLLYHVQYTYSKSKVLVATATLATHYAFASGVHVHTYYNIHWSKGHKISRNYFMSTITNITHNCACNVAAV